MSSSSAALPPLTARLPLFRAAPLLPVALALGVGILAGFYVAAPWWLWALLAATGLVLSRRWDAPVLFAVLALGGWLAPGNPASQSRPALDPAHRHLMSAVVRQANHGPERTQITLEFLAGLPDSVAAGRGLWRIYHERRQPTRTEQALLPGDTLLLEGGLAWPRGRRNPNGFDYRFYLWTRGVDLLLREPVQIIGVVPARGFHLGRRTTQLRQQATARLENWLGQPQAGLANGLLLGDRTGIDREFRNRMNVLGVGHILAVSGLHVGYVALVLFALARLLPTGRWARLLLVVPGMLGYVLLTGAHASVVRAGIMASLFAWGLSMERKPNLWNLLGAAALAGLLMNPRSLFSPSFQLSFAAVAGILHITLRLRVWIRATPLGGRLYRGKPLNLVMDLLLVSLGAQLGTLPVTLSVFHTFSIYALLANLAVVPLAGFAVITGLLSFLGGVFWAGLGALFADAMWLFLTGLQSAVELLSRLPHPQMVVGRPGAGATLLVALGALAVPYLVTPGWFRYRLKVAAILLLVANLLVWRGAVATRQLQVTFLDVGQGDAIHLALPDGQQVLVDAGGWSPRFDAGERVVWPYLRGQGIARLDAAGITHPQADHMGGLLALLRRLPVGEIWDTDHQVSSWLYRRIGHLADSLQVPIRRLAAGDRLRFGAVELAVLSPDSLAAQSQNSNNASLVLLLRYGATSLLLMGDAERGLERRLLSYAASLKSDVLKVAHHGSATSSTPAFLAAASPGVAVISVGAGNLYHHPAPEVVARLTAVAQVVHRTDLQGALVLRSDGRAWKVVHWR